MRQRWLCMWSAARCMHPHSPDCQAGAQHAISTKTQPLQRTLAIATSVLCIKWGGPASPVAHLWYQSWTSPAVYLWCQLRDPSTCLPVYPNLPWTLLWEVLSQGLSSGSYLCILRFSQVAVVLWCLWLQSLLKTVLYYNCLYSVSVTLLLWAPVCTS